MTTGVDLPLDLRVVRGPARGSRVRLEKALRGAIRSGRLPAGARLPPSRALAADLGLARNTVAEAYAQLVAEGWLTARQGSGTAVADDLPAARPPAPAEVAARGPARLSLRPGAPDVAAFPRAAWLAASRKALDRAPAEAFGYGDPQGRPELRAALTDYLARVRGVTTTPDRVVVCGGFVQAMDLLARVLAGRAEAVLALEPYGLPVVPRIAGAHRLGTTVLDADDDGVDPEPLVIRDGRRGGPHGAVLVSPAHQFPLGSALSPDRRRTLLAWARRTDSMIIEDDYDGEFRYDRQPVAALQGLDPDRVVYLGTASKSLAPALRLAWMVLPEPLVGPVLAAKELADRLSPTLEQLTLAELITEGGYDRQVRARRLAYRRRRDRLVEALARRHPRLPVTGLDAGLHLVVGLPSRVSEAEAVEAGRRHGVDLDGLDHYRLTGSSSLLPGPVASRPPALVVGYGTPPEHGFTRAVARLLATLDAVAG